ncbi:MAG: hypothetical protein AAF531_10175 [Actinomycetota bacterium]
MDHRQDAISIPCHNFSDIRRRPLVIGKLDQVQLPFVVTMPQLAVGLLTFGLLFLTRPVWGTVMSDRLHIVMFVAVPVLVAQQISRTTVEGRPLSKAAMGLFRLWTAPHHGTINGRKLRPVEPTSVVLHPLVQERRPRDRKVRRRTGSRGRAGHDDPGPVGRAAERIDR